MCSFKSVIWLEKYGIVEYTGVNSHSQIAEKLGDYININLAEKCDYRKLEDNSIKFEIDITDGIIKIDNCPDTLEDSKKNAISACQSFINSHWPELWAEGLKGGHVILPAISHKKRYGYKLSDIIQKKLKNIGKPSTVDQNTLAQKVLAGRLKLATAEKKIAEYELLASKCYAKISRLQKILNYINSDIPVYGAIPSLPKKWKIA